MSKQQLCTLLTTLREMNHMQQKEMADKLSVSSSTLCKWEHGNTIPNFDFLTLYAEIFHIPVEAFLHPEESLVRLRKGEDLNSPPHCEIKRKIPLKRTLIAIASVIGLTTIISVGFLYWYIHPQFTTICNRINSSGPYGPQYEMAVICSRKLSSDEEQIYINSFQERLQNEEYGEGVESLSVRFYKERKAAENWDPCDTIHIILKQ